MPAFDRIDEVQPSPQFGNCGPDGWGFTLWGSATYAEQVHRKSLERLADTYHDVDLRLPDWRDGEDLIDGSLTWGGAPVWVWFETVLNHTWLWSAERATMVGLRDAMLPIARSV